MQCWRSCTPLRQAPNCISRQMAAALALWRRTSENIAAAGCRIIVDDVAFEDKSPFQDGEIATAVADVSNQGVLYFSSAANSGNKASSTSSTYEGDFIAAGNAPSTWSSAAGPFSVRHPGNLMQFTDYFDTTTDKIILHPQSNQTTVSLFWNDPLANPNNPDQPAPNQYDLYAFDQNDQLIGFSDTTMGSTTDPLQIIELNRTVLGISHPSFVQGDYIKSSRRPNPLPVPFTWMFYAFHLNVSQPRAAREVITQVPPKTLSQSGR